MLREVTFSPQVGLNKFYKLKKEKRKILTHGNLNTSRSIISMQDALNAYWLAAKKM